MSSATRKLRFALSTAVIALGLACTANASSLLYTHSSISVLGDAPQLQGTIVVDTYYDTVTNVFSNVDMGSLVFADGINSYSFDWSSFLNVVDNTINFQNTAGDLLSLSIMIPLIVATPTEVQAVLCSIANPCSDGNGGQLYSYLLVNGSQSPILFDEGTETTTTEVFSLTPEPSSIALLGTGILGVAGAARRRFRQA